MKNILEKLEPNKIVVYTDEGMRYKLVEDLLIGIDHSNTIDFNKYDKSGTYKDEGFDEPHFNIQKIVLEF